MLVLALKFSRGECNDKSLLREGKDFLAKVITVIAEGLLPQNEREDYVDH